MSDLRERLRRCTPGELYEVIMVEQFRADPANKERLAGLEAVIQVKITGEGGGAWAMHLKDGDLEVRAGEHPSPSMSLQMTYEDWRGITTGDVNPQQAFMEGRMVITGDLSLAMQLGQLLGGGP